MRSFSHARSSSVSQVAIDGRSVMTASTTGASSTAGSDSSRNTHFQPAMPQTPSSWRMAPEIIAAAAFEPGAARYKVATTRARYTAGNQYVKYSRTPGKKPASATPSRKRTTRKLRKPVMNIMAPDATPQVIMMRAIQTRAPIRCRMTLLGTSNRK